MQFLKNLFTQRNKHAFGKGKNNITERNTSGGRCLIVFCVIFNESDDINLNSAFKIFIRSNIRLS